MASTQSPAPEFGGISYFHALELRSVDLDQCQIGHRIRIDYLSGKRLAVRGSNSNGGSACDYMVIRYDRAIGIHHPTRARTLLLDSATAGSNGG